MIHVVDVKKAYVYALKHPVTGDVLYVGRTTNPNRRLSQHRHWPQNEKLRIWRNRLIAEKLDLQQVILEITDELNIVAAERRWIRFYADAGCSITNVDAVTSETPCLLEENMEDTEQGITVQEAAKRLGVARSTVHAWVKAGRVRVITAGHSGKGVGQRIHPDDIKYERHRLQEELKARLRSLDEDERNHP